MKKRYGCFLVVLCFISCIDSYNIIKPQLIGTGKLSATVDVNYFKGIDIINDSIKWNQLLNIIYSAYSTDSTYKETINIRESNIDFSKSTIIMCFGRFNETNYEPITKILEYENKIIVYLKNYFPIPGPYMMSFPQGYYIVKTDKTDKQISYLYEQ
jgi:hypothetical protein